MTTDTTTHDPSSKAARRQGRSITSEEDLQALEGTLKTAMRKLRRAAAIFDEELVHGDTDGAPDHEEIARAMRDLASTRIALKMTLAWMRRDPGPGARSDGAAAASAPAGLRAIPGGRP